MTDAAEVRFPPPLIFACSVGLGVAADVFVWPLRFDAIPELLRFGLGAVVAALGLVPIAFSFVHFAKTGQNPEPWKPTPEIISKGIYGLSRNPMYLGMAVLQLACGLGSGRLWIVGLIPVSLAAVFIIAVRPEEAYLEEKFGAGYVNYKARVRRWL